MPSYADDDDAVDYEQGIPDFQDEGELDDYLNDEEFDLMNELFPQAKKELKEYQGWDNLAVKLAIFDSDFNLDEALIELKKTFKKKKQPTAASEPKKPAIGMYSFDDLRFLSLHNFLSSFPVSCFLRDFQLTYLLPSVMCPSLISCVSLFRKPWNSEG